MVEQRSATPGDSQPADSDAPAWGWLLTVWMILVVLLNGAVWTTGVRDYYLTDAVERGAARVEERTRGEENRDVIRKEIQLQRDTLTFWTVITAISDFLVAPLSIALRAFLVAVAFSAVAAMTGRQVRFPAALAGCVAWQGIWVLGLAVQVVLMVVLREAHVETSVLLLLPAGTYSASRWVFLQQIDLFAIVGWLSLAWGACRRGQANLFAALAVCVVLALGEAAVFASGSLLVNLSMRLTLMPE